MSDRREQTDVSVYYAGSQSCTPGHSWGGIRDHYLVHVVERGKGEFNTDGNAYTIGRAGVFLIRPGDLVRYRADLDEPWTYHWIGFGGDGARSVIERSGLSDGPRGIVLSETAIDRFLTVHRELTRSVASGSTRIFAATGLLYETIQILYDAVRPTTVPSPAASPPVLYVEAVYDFVRKNYSRRTSVEEIARHVGLSRKYLSELVRSKTGSTPHEILLHHRLHTARELLLTTDLAVGDVARSCGYHDPLLFSRRFSQFFRCAPTEFRSRRRAAVNQESTAGIECE